ncbi:MAG: anaerobic sulfatase maturase, partial [Deltaproteobacteria bacterium]|nr:anaerobic sulfatase maturase [Deltaproteobacteria bacterium]
RQLSFGKIKSRLPNVWGDCKWLDYCRGGCIKDRMRDPKDNGVNHFCESFKMFFEHADAKLKRLASRVQPS